MKDLIDREKALDCFHDWVDVWRSTDKEVKAWIPLPEPYREEKR